MLLTLIMYGSRARGDHRHSSDVDLLGITESGRIDPETSVRGASFYTYPSLAMLNNARSGDLFTLHLIEEGLCLHDTLNFFSTMKNEFLYKTSYNEEIETAQSVLHYLSSNRKYCDREKYRKRMIWAIRTILIARSAERRSPIFSSSKLEDFSGQDGLKILIDKRKVVDPIDMINAADSIAEKFGLPHVNRDWPADRSLQEAKLRQLGGIAEDSIGLASAIKLKFIKKKVTKIPLPAFSAYDVS